MSVERMRATLLMIASGVGPNGGRLGVEQVRDMAMDAAKIEPTQRELIESFNRQQSARPLAQFIPPLPAKVTKRPSTSKSDAKHQPAKRPARKPRSK